MKRKNSFIFFILFVAGSLFAKELPADKVVTKIAFGSCQRPEKGLGIYKVIGKTKPQLMLLLGDNIYASTIQDKEKKYQELKSNPDFKKFSEKYPVYAIWDDNDYGTSDTGAEYPFRKESEKLFKNNFNFPVGLERDGIYQSLMFGKKESKRLQIILLDTRSFRSLLKLSPTPLQIGSYVPNDDKNTTVLGEVQWKWLEEELKKPAEIRLVLTGYQFLPVDLHFESWNNFPHERERMFELIKSTNAGGVLFLSGDRHIGMFLHESKDRPYEIWEATSSGLTNALPDTAPVDPEKTLDGKLYFGPNFGLINIDWKSQFVNIQLRSEKGKVVREKRLSFKSLHVVPQVK